MKTLIILIALTTTAAYAEFNGYAGEVLRDWTKPRYQDLGSPMPYQGTNMNDLYIQQQRNFQYLQQQPQPQVPTRRYMKEDWERDDDYAW